MKKNKRTFLDRAFFWLSRHDLLNWMSDQMYIRIAYRIKMGRKIDFNCPKTFNEKLNWLKVYDRKPIYTRMVDKYEVKGLVSDLIGKEYVIPSIGIWDNFDDIDFDSLPNEFVIKSTHDSRAHV